MTTTDQPRVPAGHPSGNGGEFAAKPAPEADVVLDELYREGEGTFHYPAVCRTLDSLMAFWSSVQVPEESLVRFQQAYARLRRGRIDAALERWDQANPEPRGRKHDEWATRRQEAIDQLEQREPIMYAGIVRPLVRLNRMYFHRSSLRLEEEQEFLAKQFRLPTGDEGTVEELLAKYRTSEYQGVLTTSRVDEHGELLEQLRRTTVNLQVELKNIRKGI